MMEIKRKKINKVLETCCFGNLLNFTDQQKKKSNKSMDAQKKGGLHC